MSLIDRVSAGLDQIGKRTLQAIDESKLRLELGGVRRRKDAAARDLGYLTYRRSEGEIVPEGEAEGMIRRIAKAEEEAASLEARIAVVRAQAAPPGAEAAGRPEALDAKEPDGRREGPDAKEPGGSQ
jgi:hypothetical protein